MWLTTCILYTYIVVFEGPVWVLQCMENSFLFSCHKVLCLFLFGQNLPLWKKAHVMSTHVQTFHMHAIYWHTFALWKVKSNVLFLIPLSNICWCPCHLSCKVNDWAVVGRANWQHKFYFISIHYFKKTTDQEHIYNTTLLWRIILGVTDPKKKQTLQNLVEEAGQGSLWLWLQGKDKAWGKGS